MYCDAALCATLFCVLAKFMLCLYDCVCACVYVALRTGSSGDALTPPTIDITMESPIYRAAVPNVPPLLSNTHMENSHAVVLCLCWAANTEAESGSVCMFVSTCVWGQRGDDGKAKRRAHKHGFSLDTCEDKHYFP